MAAGAAVDAAAAAEAERLAPTAKADALKLVKELGAPSAPQLMAKTIPAPQWLAGVLAA